MCVWGQGGGEGGTQGELSPQLHTTLALGGYARLMKPIASPLELCS